MQRILSAVCLLALAAAGLPRAAAQAPRCNCTDTRPFGSCLAGSVDYVGQDPGCAVVVPGAGGAAPTLYVIDFSNGFAYSYGFANNQLTRIECPDVSTSLCLVAPLGSQPTPTGVAYNSDSGSLLWALGGFLYRSNADLASPAFRSSVLELARIDMATLAELLELPQVGEVGGITYDRERGTLWGVDVVNGVYFEFGFDGKPIVEGDRVLAFYNPRLGQNGAGAFGNAIAYTQVGGVGYFDISVGSLTDGTVTMVERVYGHDGEKNGQSYSIGDPTGIYYPLAPLAGAGATVTNLAHWPGTCAAQQDTEVLLALGSDDAEPQVLLASADHPAAAGLASFSSSANGNNVALTWKTFDAYDGIEIVRTDLATGDTKTVLSILAGVAGETTETDRNVSDGSYEYAATLTTTSGQVLAPRRSRLTVGRGTVVKAVSFKNPAFPANETPFAITHVGGARNIILVAEFNLGFAHAYDLDLEPKGVFPGPFHRAFNFIPGPTSGVAWIDGTDEVAWTQNRLTGVTVVQRTRLVDQIGGGLGVELIDEPVMIRVPRQIHQPWLGDIDYDPLGQQFWGADRVNGVAYSFRADGSLSGKSFTTPIPNPRTDGLAFGIAGGGLALIESSASLLTLDWNAGPADAEYPGTLDRQAYSRNLTQAPGGPPADEVFVPGRSTLAIDLVTSTGTRYLGGLVHVVQGEEQFEYVVSWETATIFKLRMTEGLSGKEFVRGDANIDGILNISDPSFILAFLFKGGAESGCADSADVNDDESINLTDAVYLFQYLFLSGSPPADPFEVCGRDFDEGLTCQLTNCR